MQAQKTLSQTVGRAIWRDSGRICSIADHERHLGYIVLTDRWHAYDGTRLNEAGDGFRYLGAFDLVTEGKRAVEQAVAAAQRSGDKRYDVAAPANAPPAIREIFQ